MGLLIHTHDLGSYGSKIIDEWFSDGKPNYSGILSCLIMEPQWIEVSRKSIEFYQGSRMITPQPQDEAWVSVGGKHYAVGFLAKEQFKVPLRLGELKNNLLKYDGSVPKVLAGVGAAAARLNLPSQFAIALAILLPYKEWEDRHDLEKELKAGLANFSFQDRAYSVELVDFLCVPEGGGLAVTLSNRFPQQFQEQHVVSAMIGLRDLSLVQLYRNQLNGITERLGFSELLKLVEKKTSGLDAEALLPVLHASKGNKIELAELRRLSKRLNPTARDLKQASSAITVAQKEYWRRVSLCLQQSLPEQVEIVIVGGGTADYLHPTLAPFFAQQFPQVKVSWFGELYKDVRQRFEFPDGDHRIYRFADPYGTHLYQKRRLSKRLSAA